MPALAQRNSRVTETPPLASREEKDELVTICHRLKTMKHSTSRPYVFTEYGVVMLSSVLRSKRAIQVNIAIMRAFVKLRQLAIFHAELAKKPEVLEKNMMPNSK
jgi:hypothetical protein